MEWVESIGKAIRYIEDNITEELTIDQIANSALLSPFYFQKGFSMLCGFTVGEYIRQRRLSLAGSELVSTDERVIDIAIKYGYDSPDSFTKAFIRFHGVTPSNVRKSGAPVKEFVPLKLNLDLRGGYIMEYRIEEKESFSVVGLANTYKYENAEKELPKLWKSFFMKSMFKGINAKYGINYDSEMKDEEFEYMLCDDYSDDKKIPKDFTIKKIPKFTWAVFPCVGPVSKTLPEVNEKIFKEWLSNTTSYEIAAGYNIEMYSDPKDYKNNVNDEKYYCEVWIPVNKKSI